MGLDHPTGVLLTGVQPNSPAAQAGLKAGDIIYAVDGKEVSDPGMLRYRIATLPLGQSVTVTLIRAGATGTDTYEENRNLLLGDRARADSVPNLEIETGEVAGAGHASTTGRFDDEQLFYLMARGIPEDEARRLVVRGFFAEIVDRIGVPEVRERLLSAVEGELAR